MSLKKCYLFFVRMTFKALHAGYVYLFIVIEINTCSSLLDEKYLFSHSVRKLFLCQPKCIYVIRVKMAI